MFKPSSILLVMLFALFAATGCQQIEQSQTDHPIAWGIGKTIAHGAALAAVDTLTDDAAQQAAIRAAINAAFAAETQPEAVASSLQLALAQAFPGDPDTQNIILLDLQSALEASPQAPASGPERSYSIQLAAALAAPLSYQPTYRITVAAQ